MQETVTRYSDEMQRSQGVPVQICVSLHSGAVVVWAIDSSLHMDYTAVGQTTHLAARREQMAKPGSVLTTGETLRLAIRVRPGQSARPRRGQGAGGPGGGVRARLCQLHPDTHAGVCGPWAHPFRRAAGGGGAGTSGGMIKARKVSLEEKGRLSWDLSAASSGSGRENYGSEPEQYCPGSR